MSRRFEVAIVGGGLVGSALALLLKDWTQLAPARIAVIEPRPARAPSPASPIGLRVSNISPANRQRFEELGVWQRLDAARMAPVQAMAIWQQAIPPDSPDVLRFDAAESGAAELGVIVENLALQAALLQACRDAGIVIIEDQLAALGVAPECATLTLANETLQAELVVGADGAASAVRGMLGLPADTHAYGQQAIVGCVRPARAHHGTAYQRFLSTGPLALLPLPDGACSIVWSVADAQATRLMSLPPDAFSAELTEASARALGTLILDGERAAFPLRRLHADHYVAPRAALVGDAAHVIHPLAGQGVNQGFEDAAALAAALAQRPPRESVGAMQALRRYERERRAGNALMGGVVDGLDRLFTGSAPLVSWAARSGMAAVARLSLVRGFLVTRAAAGRSSPRR